MPVSDVNSTIVSVDVSRKTEDLPDKLRVYVLQIDSGHSCGLRQVHAVALWLKRQSGFATPFVHGIDTLETPGAQ